MPNIGSFPASLYDFLWSLKQLWNVQFWFIEEIEGSEWHVSL